MMSRTRVKFCGVMTPSDAQAAVDAGADAVGMILHSGTRRQIDWDTAAKIVAVVPAGIATVGVFVDAPPSHTLALARFLELSHVQLHGDETPGDVVALASVNVVKAFKVDDRIEATLIEWRQAVASGRVPNLIGLLLDSAAGGGTGVATDFNRVRDLIDQGYLAGLPPITVAGGLTPENVAAVVTLLHPFAVDTSSGIETEYGRKSVGKMRAFVAAIP